MIRPSPATAASNGQASPDNGSADCTTQHGFVPARTLGIQGPTDDNNLLIDRWLRPIRYSLSAADGRTYNRSIPLSMDPDFQICPDATCTTPIADKVVAVLVSQASDTSNSADQSENTNGDTRFVTRTITEASGNEFDDEIRWISPNTLVYNLVRAGRLN